MTVPSVPTKNPTPDTAPKLQDKDTIRVQNRLEGGATAAEVVLEAHRVCRINALLRRDLHNCTPHSATAAKPRRSKSCKEMHGMRFVKS